MTSDLSGSDLSDCLKSDLEVLVRQDCFGNGTLFSRDLDLDLLTFKCHPSELLPTGRFM